MKDTTVLYPNPVYVYSGVVKALWYFHCGTYSMLMFLKSNNAISQLFP